MKPIALTLLGILTLLACGKETPTGQQQPPAPTVASVVVTPSTTTLVSLGETVQLNASAQDASGNSISGKTFTWSSSDESVATVNASGLVTAIANGAIVAIVAKIAKVATVIHPRKRQGLPEPTPHGQY